MNLLDRNSDNKMKEVHFNTTLLSLGDRGVLCTRINMKRKEYEVAENKFLNYNKLVIELIEEEEEKKEKKYVQLEFEFDEDLVAPI